MFLFKPSPDQYVSTMKEAMMVCSQIGGDLPQYASQKCIQSAGRGESVIFTRDQTPKLVQAVESMLASKNGKAKVMCQRK